MAYTQRPAARRAGASVPKLDLGVDRVPCSNRTGGSADRQSGSLTPARPTAGSEVPVALDVGDDVAAAFGLGLGLGLAVNVLRELGVGVGVKDVVAGIDVVSGGGVDVDGGLVDRVVVGTVIEDAVDAGAVDAGAVGAGAETIDDDSIAVGVPAAPLQPARVTVRAASAHPNRIRTAAG